MSTDVINIPSAKAPSNDDFGFKRRHTRMPHVWFESAVYPPPQSMAGWYSGPKGTIPCISHASAEVLVAVANAPEVERVRMPKKRMCYWGSNGGLSRFQPTARLIHSIGPDGEPRVPRALAEYGIQGKECHIFVVPKGASELRLQEIEEAISLWNQRTTKSRVVAIYAVDPEIHPDRFFV